MGCDLIGRSGRLFGQGFNFRGNYSKAPSGLAGAGGFYGRIQREKIGLAGYIGNDLHYIADFLRGFGQAPDLLV